MSNHPNNPPNNPMQTVSTGGELPLDPVLEGPLESYLPHVSTVEFPFEVGQQIELPDESEPTLGDPMERIIDEANFLPVAFLERGVEVQRAVARDLNDLPGIGSIAAALGKLFVQLQEKSQAQQYLKTALTAYKRLRSPEAEEVRLTLEQLGDE